MKTKIQIKSIFGALLFEYETENNTIKKTIEQAIKENADLSYADLRYADLRYANLSYANLRSASLSSIKNKETSYLPLFCKWSFSIKGDEIQIGCKTQTIEKWDMFFESKEVYSTQRDTEDFKQIEAVYLACKSYLTHLKS